MPATFAGTNTLYINGFAGQTSAMSGGGTRATISCWVNPSESQNNITGIMAEGQGSSGSIATDPVFCIRIEALSIKGCYIDGATSVVTTGVTVAAGSWSFVILERNGDNLTLYVWEQGTTDFQTATATGVGTGVNDPDMTAIVVGRPYFSGTAVERFKGQVAFAAGWNGLLSAIEKRELWNGGSPSRVAYGRTTVRPVYVYPLSDNTGAIRYKFAMSETSSSGAVSYAKNDTVWPDCGDPFGFDADFLDNDPDIRAFWTFQEAAPGPYFDRINNLILAYDNVVSGNGSSANNVRRGDGIFGDYSQQIDQLGFYCPADNDLLHFAGETEYTVVAWVKTFQSFTAGTQMGLVAGVWEEGAAASGDRQFALFHSLRDLNDDAVIMPPATVNGHTSNDGGITEPYQFNYEVSASGESFYHGEWVCMAVTWDGTTSRSYINGRFVEGLRNPYTPGYTSLHDSSSPFRMGGVKVSGSGSWGNWMNGDIGGLAVFARCLSEDDLERIASGEAPIVANDTNLTTTDLVLQQLGLTETTAGTAAVAFIDQLILDVSAQIGRFCNRIDTTGAHTFGYATRTEKYNGLYSPEIVLRNTPVSSVTSVQLIYDDGSTSTVSSDEYRYDPASGVLRLLYDYFGWGLGWESTEPATYQKAPGYFVGPFPRFAAGLNNVQVTYAGGWSTIPQDLQRVATQAVVDLYLNRRTNRYAALDSIGNRSTALRGVADVVNMFAQDLAPYVRSPI